MGTLPQILEQAHDVASLLIEQVKHGQVKHERLSLEDVHGVAFLKWRYDFENTDTSVAQGAPRHDSKWIYPEVVRPRPSLDLDAITEDEADAFLFFYFGGMSTPK